jgi:hypothetical protein
MSSLAAIVAKVRQNMYSFSQEQQEYTYLTNPIGTTDTVIDVADASQISRGLVEVGGMELMYVLNINRQSNTGTLLPTGRGWMNTTPASWPANTQVEDNPIFPYQRIVEAVNDAIDSVYPDLFSFGTATIIKLSVVSTSALPAACDEVMSVRYALIGPSQVYPIMRRWRFDGQASVTTFPTGRSIELLEEVTPGREMVVTYMQRPSELVNPSDDFVTVTGLPSSAEELIVYGACQRLAPSLEASRLLLDAAEVSERASMVQPGSAAKVSQSWGQLFEQRLQEERRKLYDRIERTVHFNY